ncbi:MAG: hypothetical protein RMJ19_06215 [Gemmatales bacterium]|nr:hypothetical protein [Gemmatales bacterium]MDW8175248.1 hypothetical protein [Gemmatales bacterium]
MRLYELALARSGDKGNHANIGVLARSAEAYSWLCRYLTAERVAEYFRYLEPRKVDRYLAPNIWGLNFVLYNVLAGGAARSLRLDSQGKALASALLEMAIEELPP